MSEIDKLIESNESVKKNFEYEEQMKKVMEEVVQKFVKYRETINYMLGDAPIQILGLNKNIENLLLAHKLLRIYDLFDCDFTKVKGLGIRRIDDLTTSLDKFFSML
jgi:hypothetical protein